MKKYKYGIAAILIAVGGFAFTKHTVSKSRSPVYWFQITSGVFTGASINGATITASAIQPVDPYICIGAVYDCSVSFPGYAFVSPGLYVPSLTPDGTALSPSQFDMYKSSVPTTKK